MLECSDCGARNSAGTTFCARCGAQLAVAPEAPSAPSAEAAAGRVLDEAAEAYAAGRLDDAASACRTALDADPDLASARSLLGMIEEERGNLAAALAEFEAVVRLAPERTAERERADRLRETISAQAAPAIPEEDAGEARKRWAPIAIAVAAALVFLTLGAVWISGRGNPAEQPGIAATGTTTPIPGRTATRSPATAGSAGQRGLSVTSSPLMGRPIGQPASRSTSSRRAGRVQYPSSANPPLIPPIDLIPPPPSIAGDPLQGIGPVPDPAYPTPAEGAGFAPTPGASTGSAPSRPAGRIRYWLGQSDGAGASGPSQSGGGSAAGDPGNAGQGGARSNRLLPASASGGSSGGVVLAQRARTRVGDEGGAATRARTAGGGARPSARSGSSTAARSAGGAKATTQSRSGGNSSTATTRSGVSAQGGATHMSRSGGTPAASSGRSSRAPTDLRSGAQQAWAAGRTDEAKRLYRDAISGYEADLRSNPERAATSRSAIESCSRALDAMDAGQ